MNDKTKNIQTHHITLFSAVAIALLIRIAFLVAWEKFNLEPRFGHDGYVNLAEYWLGWRPDLTDFNLFNPGPGFAAVCAIIFKTLGSPNYLAIRILNIFLSSLSCLMLGIWATNIMGEKVGRLSAFFFAFSPIAVFFSPHLQSESMFILCELIFFIFLLKYAPFKSTALAFGHGLMVGLLSLIRLAFAVYLPVLTILFLLQFRKKIVSAIAIVVFLLGAFLPIFSWGTFNFFANGRFIPLSASSGITLFAGISLNATDRYERITVLLADMESRGIKNWVDKDREFMRQAKEFIKANPVQYAKIVIKKFFIFWRIWPRDPYPLLAQWILGAYYFFIFITALFGVWNLRGKTNTLMPIFALFFAISISHSFLDTSLRYRMPLEPFLCFFASVGLMAILNRVRIPLIK